MEKEKTNKTKEEGLDSDSKKLYLEQEVEYKNSLTFYWKEVQRSQLGISANVYLTFASAITGFLINYLLNSKSQISCFVCCFSSCALLFLIASIVSYGLFTNNRLTDFRKTAKHYKEGKTVAQVSELTASFGERTWSFYYAQIFFLIIGFVFSLITVFNLIYI